MESVSIRDAEEGDMGAIAAIYAHYVRDGLASFEETAPTIEEMIERRRAVRSLGLPYLAASRNGDVVGYSYATAYRSRPAYRFTVENSVYVAKGRHGRGIGSALLQALIAACGRGPWRQMVAVIGDSANTPSIGLHARHGFRMIGTIENSGFKFGRWVDTVLMQRPIGEGGRTVPAGFPPPETPSP